MENRQIAGLDIAKGLERYLNDEESYLTIMRSYTASMEIFALDIAKDAEAFEKAAVARGFGYVDKPDPHHSGFSSAQRNADNIPDIRRDNGQFFGSHTPGRVRLYHKTV